MTTTTVVPLPPERTDDPMTLRWRVRHTMAGQVRRGTPPAPDHPAVGPGAVDAGPGDPVTAPLLGLLDTGVLTDVRICPDHIATTLAGGRTWRADGPAVRAAIQATVREHDRRVDAAGPAGRDAVLALVARQVIAEAVTPVAGAHGGAVELVGAAEGVVTVRMQGACRGCPASAATLHGRLERELRRRLPWARGVEVA
jgi:Fe-S cluster biogenesis protein NfuA